MQRCIFCGREGVQGFLFAPLTGRAYCESRATCRARQQQAERVAVRRERGERWGDGDDSWARGQIWSPHA